ncbi:ttm3 [Drosophila busckii]|uniref:Mitochondrial import inner membrane translocase subunit TIM50 n=2 Tax=Drosophila busckii TaxID=30019 RepID=A0A0M3QT53_DROBS|nr:ttm3 [Drosophila busckii]
MAKRARLCTQPAPKESKPNYGLRAFLGSLCGLLLWAIYELGKPEYDQCGRCIEDELSGLPLPQQYLQRMWRALHYYEKMLDEPLPTRLLPDILMPPYVQPRYTLVLELKDVLVHPDWTYQTGRRYKKRPGVDHFLRQCSKHFEIVIYTAEQGMTAFPILDALDPHGFIQYRLVRGATQLVDGQHIKNLNRLNRNLARVIVVDWDHTAIPMHPDNIFNIVRWLGNDDDVQLFDLAAFLQLIAEHQLDDVREVLHYYRQFDDPIEQFKENQRKLLEQKQEEPDNKKAFN